MTQTQASAGADQHPSDSLLGLGGLFTRASRLAASTGASVNRPRQPISPPKEN